MKRLTHHSRRATDRLRPAWHGWVAVTVLLLALGLAGWVEGGFQ